MRTVGNRVLVIWLGLIMAMMRSAWGVPVARIDSRAADPQGTLALAATELESLSGKVPGGDALAFTLKLDQSLMPFSFRILRQGHTLELAGQTPSEILTAAYTALEQMGYRFEVTGPVAPAKLEVDKVAERQMITPAVQRRGIRQHINFNMDVSGYPLNEAKEYIRNLARLRYNFMTFHSYPCHWTRERCDARATFSDFTRLVMSHNLKPGDLVSGGYFYGAEFRIPNHPLIRPAIRFNKEYFCVPEFEPVIHKLPERGEVAQAWLREVMKEARRCGMTLNFSTEIRSLGAGRNRELVDRIAADYPMIQWLELISPESGDFRDPNDEPANVAMAREIITSNDESALASKYFGKAGLTGGLAPQLRNYALNIRTIRQLQAQNWEAEHSIRLVCGSYACTARSVQLELGLAEEFLPPSTLLAVMPGHSSREVSRVIQEADPKPEILKRLLLHSWLEFDGLMMLQQQTAEGLHDVGKWIQARTGGQPVFGLACNHWRTGPNRVSFRYLGQWSLEGGGLDPASFFTRYGRELGIPETKVPEFVRAMQTIDELSDVRAIAGNCGFNLGWTLDEKKPKIGMVWWWPKGLLISGRNRHFEVHKQLQAFRKDCASPSGQLVLDQLINGTACTVEHLDGILALRKFTDKYYDGKAQSVRDNLSDADRALIVQITNEADAHFQKYLKLLAGHLTDRGEEGMLVTYYTAPVLYCNNIRAIYGKRGKVIQVNAEEDVVPQPLTEVDEKRMGK